MIFFFGVLVACLFYKMQYSSFNKQYLSKDTTNAIKGLFVIMVFLSHSISYIQMDNMADTMYVTVRRYLGQLIVCMFLFYSGYGVFESIKHKKDYMKHFLRNRLLKTWIHFALAILCFIVVDYFLGYKFKLKTYVLAFTGWESVNNSNWFLFCILYMYIVTYLACKIAKSFHARWLWMVFFTIVYILLTHHYKDYWWWDTSVCYLLGMLYSIVKDDIEKDIQNQFSGVRYFLLCGLFVLLLSTTYIDGGIYTSLAKSTFFTVLVVLLTMRFNVRNKVLIWFGENTFNIFILQRIPMMFLSKMYPSINKYCFVFICFIITLLMSEAFNIVIKRIDNMLLRKKKDVL